MKDIILSPAEQIAKEIMSNKEIEISKLTELLKDFKEKYSLAHSNDITQQNKNLNKKMFDEVLPSFNLAKSDFFKNLPDPIKILYPVDSNASFDAELIWDNCRKKLEISAAAPKYSKENGDEINQQERDQLFQEEGSATVRGINEVPQYEGSKHKRKFKEEHPNKIISPSQARADPNKYANALYQCFERKMEKSSNFDYLLITIRCDIPNEDFFKEVCDLFNEKIKESPMPLSLFIMEKDCYPDHPYIPEDIFSQKIKNFLGNPSLGNLSISHAKQPWTKRDLFIRKWYQAPF